jgi:hypothetical protein
MKEISAAIQIAADANVAWSILTGFAHYPQWNPMVVGIEGKPRVGERLRVTIELPDASPTMFRSVVTEARKHRVLRWRGCQTASCWLTAEHSLRIEPMGERTFTFRHSMRFGGLVSAFRGKIIESAGHGLELMNVALKRVVEAGSVETWKSNRHTWTSEDYAWKPLYQSRFYHDVIKAIRIIRNAPRPIETMSLNKWRCGTSAAGMPTLYCPNGISYGYRPDKLPTDLHLTHPVLIGEIRGKALVIDGCHRLAKSILTGRPCIAIVRLTVAETTATIRDGFERKVEFESVSF